MYLTLVWACLLLRGKKQAHTSPPPLTTGNTREVESSAPLEELNFRAQTVRGDEPDYIWPAPFNLLHKLTQAPSPPVR